MSHVFISYSSKDRPFVLQLAQDLRSCGVPIWLDRWKITGREPYWDEIQKGVEGASYLLFVISPDSIEKSCGARRELYHGAGLKPAPIIVPIMVRPTPFEDLPILLSPGELQIHDFTKLDYAEGLRLVLIALGYREIIQPPILAKPSQLTDSFPIYRRFPPRLLIIVATTVLVISAIILIVNIFGGDNNRPRVENTSDPNTTITTQSALRAMETGTASVLDMSNTPEKIFTLTPTPFFLVGSSNREWTPVIQEFDGVEMVYVPTGCFIMGSNLAENETPLHRVCFEEPFWIDLYEVTNAQYGTSGRFSGSDRPRENINWFAANYFCQNRNARLPTEAEWEYAARGPESWIYPWGNEFVSENTVWGDNSLEATVNVGSRLQGASWVGAFDMSGNVWEWVADWYGPYQSGEQTDPNGPPNGTNRVIRGGHWYSYLPDGSDGLRATYRYPSNPDHGSNNIGFRCVSADH